MTTNDAPLTEDEFAAIAARLNLYVERGGPDSEIMYFEDFVPIGDVRRLVVEVRRLRSPPAALRRAYEPPKHAEQPKTLYALRARLTDAVVNGVGMRFNAADVRALCDALGDTFNDGPQVEDMDWRKLYFDERDKRRALEDVIDHVDPRTDKEREMGVEVGSPGTFRIGQRVRIPHLADAWRGGYGVVEVVNGTRTAMVRSEWRPAYIDEIPLALIEAVD